MKSKAKSRTGQSSEELNRAICRIKALDPDENDFLDDLDLRCQLLEEIPDEEDLKLPEDNNGRFTAVVNVDGTEWMLEASSLNRLTAIMWLKHHESGHSR